MLISINTKRGIKPTLNQKRKKKTEPTGHTEENPIRALAPVVNILTESNDYQTLEQSF